MLTHASTFIWAQKQFPILMNMIVT
jgi:hypothetical protein